MEHRPYPKIPVVDPSTLTSGVWVATEKIHGANMVVATDGTDVRFGKRKAWLEPTDAFFGWQVLRGPLTDALRAAFEALGAVGTLRVYGELFGGRYPHPDVPEVAGFAPVQTGIWYSPELCFAVFDALWEPADGEATFLAWSALEDLAQRAGLGVVPVLGLGTRAALRSLPVRYESLMSRSLGLPPLAENVAEGFVLKPEAAMAPAGRPLIKCKIPEFDERGFDESLPWPSFARLSLEELVAHGRRMINPPRLASARSKLGETTAELLADEVALDVRVDLEEAFPMVLSHEDDEALFSTLRRLALETQGV